MKPVALKNLLKNYGTIYKSRKDLFQIVRVEGSKQTYVLLAHLEGEDRHLLSTVMKKKLEVRFMVGGGARNDRFHIISSKKHKNPGTNEKALMLWLNKNAKALEFKCNAAHEYSYSKNLDLWKLIYRLSNIQNPNDDEANAELLRIYNNANETYHNQQESPLSDADFDRLRTYLLGLGLIDEGKSGAPVAETKQKVEIVIPKGSLKNAMSDAELKDWAVKKGIKEFTFTPKIDGISGQLTFEKGVLKLATTKGDGTVGEDVTRHAKLISGVPAKISDKDKITVEGEFYIENSVFNAKYKRTDKNPKGFKTARNAMGGALNRKTPDREMLKDCRFTAYTIASDVEKPKNQQLEFLRQLGFDVVPYQVVPLKSLDKANDALQHYRSNLDYEMDGLVVDANSSQHRKGFEPSSLNPAYARAFKPQTDSVLAKVIRVEWNTSKDGYLKPVLILGPVE